MRTSIEITQEEINRWYDEWDWLIPDDAIDDCRTCDYWIDGEGCARHCKGKGCSY